MLVATGIIHHLRHFGFRNLVAEDTNHREAFLMHLQHNFKGLRMVHAKEPLQHDDNKFHRCVIVVQQQHLIARRPLGTRAGLGQKAKVALIVRIVRHHYGVL